MASSERSFFQCRFLLLIFIIFLFLFIYIFFDKNWTYYLCHQTIEAAKPTKATEAAKATEVPEAAKATEVPEAAKASKKALEDTILLIWMWPFGRKFDLDCSSFNIDGCYLTADRELYNKAHGVLINHRDIKSDLSNLPTTPRPFFQKWIWMNFESPENSGRYDGLENLFNVTLNYRRDADITLREQIMLKSEYTEDKIFPQVLDKKDKLVCWILSNWNERHERVKYFYELKKHIDIHVFGSHFNHYLSPEQYKKTLTSCKFYLSFENTHIHRDYMTEKLFNPLTLGSVPVTLGPPRYVYERFVPGDAFIHVDDFPSPQKLAEHLLSVDKNVEEYKKYFKWRKHFEVKHVNYPQEHACRACQYIREKKDYQVFRNLNKWYWEYINDGT